MKMEYLVTKPTKTAIAHFVFAHGAGAPMDHPFMNTIATGLAERGILVSRFEFPYMAKRRVDGKRRGPGGPKALLETWREVISDSAGELPLFIGGKSMGGRIATMVASESPKDIDGIICLGYPFHPPGKPDKLRTEHLMELEIPTIIVQGERDTFGRKEEVLSYGLPKSIKVVWIPDGDHSLKPRKSSGYTESDNISKAVDTAADFILTPSLNQQKR